MPSKSKTNSDYAARLLKQTQALQLRAHGHNLRAIARALGCSLSTAHKLVNDAAAEERKGISSAKADLVELELLRCDTYLQALAKKVQAQDVRAIEAALKVSKRRSELLGLDAPQKAELSGPDGGPVTLNIQPVKAMNDDSPIDNPPEVRILPGKTPDEH